MIMDDFQSKDHRDLLDIIDQLRSQGFSRYVDLPEIIVCGDQSSGKSSVLEAISGMSFPTKDDVCTRFATELILRRHPVTSVRISITPGEHRESDDRDNLSAWRPDVNLDDVGLGPVVDKAKEVMGINASKSFSNDTLRIEVSGPTQPHLTLVDLPGIFRASNTEQSADDVQLVRNMVISYMKRPRSIILAVISAKYDYVLQEVRELARKYDPEGSRTVGLITKPDFIDSGSDSEQRWLKLARNQEIQLKLGWHVLKNRSYDQRDFTSAQRDEDEKIFFSQGVWASFDTESCGVKNLKPRLSMVLKDQIITQLPSLVSDVERNVEDCSARLARLGDDRAEPEDQRRYLTRVSQQFSDLMNAATQAVYNNNSFFGDTRSVNGLARRLRAGVRNRLDEFAREMREMGHSEVITESENDLTYGNRTVTRSKYINDVKELMRLSRGCELPGLFNPGIIQDLFAKQCQPWHDLTKRMSKDILDSVNHVTTCIVKEIAAEDSTNAILRFLSGGIDHCAMKLEQKLDELLMPQFHLHPMTYNPQFVSKVQAAQRKRSQRSIEQKIQDEFGPRIFVDKDSKVHANPARIVDIFLNETEMDMNDFGSSIAVDYMEAYYAIALDRFIDVSAMAVESCLISKLHLLLMPSSVFELGEAEIANLVGESEETTLCRTQLKGKLKILQTGLRDLRAFQRQRDADFKPSQDRRPLESEASSEGTAPTPITPRHEATSPEPRRAGSMLAERLAVRQLGEGLSSSGKKQQTARRYTVTPHPFHEGFDDPLRQPSHRFHTSDEDFSD